MWGTEKEGEAARETLEKRWGKATLQQPWPRPNIAPTFLEVHAYFLSDVTMLRMALRQLNTLGYTFDLQICSRNPPVPKYCAEQ